MAKKKHNYTNENSKYYFIESLAKANPNVPIHNIIHAVENDISTPEMMIGDWNMYYNPAFYRLLEDKWIVSNKSRQEEIDKYPKIPYIKDKEIRLKKGRFNTGKISTNVLDSIWDSSKRVGIPFEEALGLAGRESTLGIGRGFKEGHDISPTALLSNWQQVQTVINNNEDVKKFNSIKKKADSNIKLTQEEIDFAEFFLDNERLEEESTRPIKENVFDNAFKYYMEGNYNRGDSRHTKMVQDDGKVLMTEPAIQEWLKTKNKHDGGGFLSNIGTILDGWNSNLTDKFLDSNLGKGLSSFGIKSGSLGGIANTAATAIGGLLAGKNKTGVGNALQGIGSLASNIPGVGGLIGAGVNLIGGITNAAFGSNINKEFVNQTEAQAKQQANYVSGATDNDSLLSDWSSLSFLGDINKSDVGSDGWFSNKAGRETDRLNTLVDEANMRALASISNTAENIDKQNDLMLMANYSAYGGPLDMKYTGTMSPFGNQFGDGGSKKRKYIGGSKDEVRRKYFNYDTELSQVLSNLAASYGISPALVFDRLGHEGLIDRLIRDNNEWILSGGDPNYPSDAFDMDDYNEPFGLLGLDNIFDTYTRGFTKTKRPINFIRQVNLNERNEKVNSGETKNLYDTLELFVAELASRRNQVKKQYPNLTDDELDSATAARYNASNKYFKQLMDNGEYKTKYPINVKGINIPTPTKTDSKYIQEQEQNVNVGDILNELTNHYYGYSYTADGNTFTFGDKSWNPKLFVNEYNEIGLEHPMVDTFINNYINDNYTIPSKVKVNNDYYEDDNTMEINKKANGGNLFTNGVTTIGNGGTHEYLEGQEYDVTEEEIKLLKKLGYEFEYL